MCVFLDKGVSDQGVLTCKTSLNPWMGFDLGNVYSAILLWISHAYKYRPG